MTVSAVARLIPRPPARVDNRKQKSFKKITKPTVSYQSLSDSLYFVCYAIFLQSSNLTYPISPFITMYLPIRVQARVLLRVNIQQGSVVVVQSVLLY